MPWNWPEGGVENNFKKENTFIIIKLPVIRRMHCGGTTIHMDVHVCTKVEAYTIKGDAST